MRSLHLDKTKTERLNPQPTLYLLQNVVNKMNDSNTKAVFHCNVKTNVAEIVNWSLPEKFTAMFLFSFR